MRFPPAIIALVPLSAGAADIGSGALISCVSDQSSLQGRHGDAPARKPSEAAQSWFSAWLMRENFGDGRSRVSFVWRPDADDGPSITVETTEKPHNLLRLRSRTRNSLILVTSASSPFSTESWTFSINFRIETVIATRVQSNIAGVKGEVITYDCRFETLETTPAPPG